MKTAIHRWGWPLAKGVLALAVLAAIGHKFYDDLRHLDLATLELRPGWLALSGGLYLLGLLPSAWYWYHLMHVFGDRPHPLAALRAHFMGQLGKYVPGKAVALILRGSFVRGPDVRFGVAIIGSFYEVLATIRGGRRGGCGRCIFAFDPPDDIPGLAWHPALTGLLLLGLCGVPLLPGVFNFIVGRMSRRFDKVEAFRLPPLRARTLVVGLVATAAGWLLLGLSVLAILHAVMPAPPSWSFAVWMRCTGGIGFAYVAGFLSRSFCPGGTSGRARTSCLARTLLAFAEHPKPIVAVAVLLSCALVWTAFEVIFAGLRLRSARPAPTGRRQAAG